MRPAPAPKPPGRSLWERLDNASRTVLTVSKGDLVREEAKEKKWRQKKNKRT